MPGLGEMELKRKLVEDDGLLDEDTDSEDEHLADQIESILLQLIPTYYQYRNHLIQILKDDGLQYLIKHQQINNALTREKLEQISELQRQKSEEGELKVTRRQERVLVTEKLIEKQRERLGEQRELMNKYEMRQIKKLMGEEEPDSGYEEEPSEYEQPSHFRITFDQNSKKSIRRSSIEDRVAHHKGTKHHLKKHRHHPMTERQKFHQPDPVDEELGHNEGRYLHEQEEARGKKYEEQPQDYQASELSEEINHNQPIINNKSQYKGGRTKVQQSQQPKRHPEPGQQSGTQIKTRKSSYAIEKKRKSGRNSGRQRDEGRGQFQDFQIPADKSNRVENLKVQRLQIPPVYDEESISEGDDIYTDPNESQMGIHSSQQNMVRVEYDETHSQHHKPFSRHNTPNFDTFSHRNHRNPYFDIQREKIARQKRQAELLHRQVDAVLGGDMEMDAFSEQKSQKKSGSIKDSIFSGNNYNNQLAVPEQVYDQKKQEKHLAGFKCVLEELCQLWSMSEYYKYLLRNKQYSILEKVCRNEIGTGPISIKLIQKGAESLLKQEEKQKAHQIVRKIFGNLDQLSFEDFGKALTPKINESQFKHINVKVAPVNPHEVLQLTRRLFSVYSEIIYFENKARQNLVHSSKNMEEIKNKISSPESPNNINLLSLEQFIYATYTNRVNRLRITLFLKNTLKENKTSYFLDWLNERHRLRDIYM